jgi:UDP-glucose 4-epimerase
VLVGDLAENIALPQDVDAVVHTAAVSPGPAVEPTVTDFARNNIEATRRLILWARSTRVRKFIYFSSISVFGSVVVPELDESCQCTNPDAYGISKWMGELMLAEQNEEIASVSIRLPGVIGPAAVRNWLATMAALAKKGREIAYFNGDADYNNAVHIDDLCRLVVNMLCEDFRGHDMITLGAGGAMKVRDMITTIAVGLGGHSPLREIPSRRPAFTISSARAQRLYGYSPMAMPAMLARFVTENK